MQNWHRFREADLSREITAFLAASKLEIVKTIWRRHHLEYDLITEIAVIIPAIPESVPPVEYLQWLEEDVFPQALPQHHQFIMDWVNVRARTYELYHKESWPENAINLVNACGCIIERHGYFCPVETSNVSAGASNLMQSPSSFADQLCGRDLEDVSGATAEGQAAASKELCQLRSQLQDLSYLKQKLSFEISLSDHSEDTSLGIVARMLERVAAAEMIQAAVDKDMRPYLARHKITGDEFLLKYMRDIMGTVYGIDTTLSGSAWETKAIAIISCIHDSNVRVEATLELMRRASVPCSKEVRALIDSALSNESMPRMAELVEQRRLMELKEMMQKYAVRHFNLTDSSLARGLMKHVLNRLDVATALDDALQVVSAYNHLNKREPYIIRFQNFVNAQCYEEAQQVVARLPGDVIDSFVHEIVFWADDILSFEADLVNAAFLETIVTCLDTLEEASVDRGASVDSINDIKEYNAAFARLKILSSQHSLTVSYSQLGDSAFCGDLLTTKLLQISEATFDNVKPQSNHDELRKIYRFCDLIGFTTTDLIAHLGDLCSTDSVPVSLGRLSISVCADHTTHSRNKLPAESLYKLASSLIGNPVFAQAAGKFFCAPQLLVCLHVSQVVCRVHKARSCGRLHALPYLQQACCELAYPMTNHTLHPATTTTTTTTTPKKNALQSTRAAKTAGVLCVQTPAPPFLAAVPFH